MLPYPEIDPVAFSIGPFTIAGNTIGPLSVHWYGLTYLVGIGLAWLLASHRSRTRNTIMRPQQVEDLTFYVAMGVVLGGRVGYIFFYNFEGWMRDPAMILRVWEGGMSFHGGLLGVILAMLLFARKVQHNFIDIMDFIAPFVPLGLLFGRIGNFIGGELYGRVTNVPWGMQFPGDPANARHPSQLYQAFFEGLVLFAVLYWFSAKPRPRAAVSALFLLLYGVFRFFVEFTREPDAHIQFDLFGWMTRGQLLSLPMILVGAALLAWAYGVGRAQAGSASNGRKAGKKQVDR